MLFFGGLLLVVLWIAPEGIAGTLATRLLRPSLRTARADGTDVLVFLDQRGNGQELRVQALSLAFGGVRAADGVSFIALPGQLTSLIGPNGVRKTIVLNVLGGLYAPDAGAVMLGTSDVTGMPLYARARAGIARTYQTTQLFPTDRKNKRHFALVPAAPSPASPLAATPCPRLLLHPQRAAASPSERPAARRSAV